MYTHHNCGLIIIVKKIDLRLIISATMKVSQHCRIAASEGNQMFGLIRRNIAHEENVTLKKAL